ncbi:signal peptide peptidase-like 2A isoform X2 [Ambystoma mexicanum]|uniref:signal peptide peptidase-like 2A isoform X2 n=1 Tax=Ambystoma mexicanum TaxID=8296 RepID=UPI0037E8BB73
MAITRRRLGAVVLLLLLLQNQVLAQEGILHVSRDKTQESTKDYCVLYNPSWTSLPESLDNVTLYNLENFTSITLCKPTDVPALGFQGGAVMVTNGTCSVLEKARLAQRNGANMLLLVSKYGIITPTDNKTLFQDVKIPVAAIRFGDVMDMQKTLGDSVMVTLYSPAVKMFDYSMLVIFLIAVFTVALGGYWSGVGELDDMRPAANGAEGEARKKDDNVTFTPLTVVAFVAVCCAMILLLYFFYKWLVYVIIAVFCLASAMSLFNCLAALITKIPYGQCRVTCFKKTAEVRLIFLAAACIALAVVWAVFRNEDRWAWILQDILGIAFCLNFIKTLRMPNFKACVILLVLLLLYDVFFVFITPFITKNGESIMVEVAAGPSASGEKSDGNLVEVPAEPSTSREKLPVVIRVPRLDFSALTLCGMPFSLLGFGDIIVPGLLIAYCRRFEVRLTSSHIYYVSCTIAYAIGMVLTFVVLALTRKGQPALLYLVPFTLLTSSVIAWRRREMKTFWTGGSYEVLESSRTPLLQGNATPGESRE